jgi:hypothetical protein
MLNQQEWLTKTLENQDSFIEELEAYLKMVESSIADEISEMKELMEKNSKCELTIEHLNLEFEKQQQEQAQL